ncbi:MAG: hypothetical protein IPP83_12850 [Flavobacteriales bacterium]|nr:hypothetical protein [Flavobacteriales bacterium]
MRTGLDPSLIGGVHAKDQKTQCVDVAKLNECLVGEHLKETFRIRKEDFTRQRKMSFDKVVLFMMNLSRRSIQVDLTKFMRSFRDGVQNVTKSAFNQSRKRYVRKCSASCWR